MHFLRCSKLNMYYYKIAVSNIRKSHQKPFVIVTLCMLDNGACFCRLLIFFLKKNTFLQVKIRNTIRVSNSLDPDQGQQNVGPDLCPNCLQKLSAGKRLKLPIAN